MIRLSPTTVQKWFDLKCPAAWKFDQEWEAAGGPDDGAERGLLVHGLLDGTIQPHEVTDALALKFYDKLQALKRSFGLESLPEGREQWHKPISIIAGVKWVRRTDDLVRGPDGEKAFVDYKTGSAWPVVGSAGGPASPQSMSFQSAGYLTPPPDERRTWPRKIVYLIAGYRGPGQVFEYRYDEDDQANLLDAVRLIKSAIQSNLFPKHRGRHCAGTSSVPGCPFVKMCYEEVGWRKLFRKKKSHA